MFVLVTGSLLMACNGNTDEDIQQSVQEKIKDQQGVTASVQDGVVTLSGNCEGENCAENIASQVKEVNGVKEVKNEISSEQETDLTLRTSVHEVISKYEGVEADVAAGVVVLRGIINRDQVQPLITEIENLQPKKIDNQLAIQ